MDMKQIEGFCHLAETLNFTKASERMFMSQSSFSRMILRLEEELGCTLFVRSKLEPHLTAAGEKIYRQMKGICRTYSDICSLAKSSDNGRIGCLRIGMPENGLTEKQLRCIREFHTSHPQISIEFKEYFESDLLMALKMEWVDVILSAHYPEIYRDETNGIVIEETSLCLIVNRENPLAERPSVSMDELHMEPFIMFRKNKSEFGFNKVLHLCLQAGFSPDIVMQADSISSMLYAVSCGLGSALVPDSFQNQCDDQIVFLPLDHVPRSPYWLIWDPAVPNPMTDLFRSFVLKQNPL